MAVTVLLKTADDVFLQMKVPKASFTFYSATNPSSFPELLDEETECDLENVEEVDGEHQQRTLSLLEKISIYSSSSRVPHGLAILESPFTSATLSTVSDLLDTHTIITATDSESFSKPRILPLPSDEDTEELTIPTLSLPSAQSGIVESPRGSAVLSTPCVRSALRELHLCQFAALPDILEIIDDDSRGLDDLERQLLRNADVDLTDANVADYLLYVAADSPSERRCLGETRQSPLLSSCRAPSQWAKMQPGPQLLELNHHRQWQRQHTAGCITLPTDANKRSVGVAFDSLQKPPPHRRRRRDKRPTQEELAALLRQPPRSCRRAAAAAGQGVRSRMRVSSLQQSSRKASCDKLAVRRSNRIRKTTTRYTTS